MITLTLHPGYWLISCPISPTRQGVIWSKNSRVQLYSIFDFSATLTSSCQKSLIAYDDGENPSFIKSCMYVWLNKMADKSCWTLVESAHLCMCHRLLRQWSRSHPHTLRHCTLSHIVNINLQLTLVHGYHWAMNGLGREQGLKLHLCWSTSDWKWLLEITALCSSVFWMTDWLWPWILKHDATGKWDMKGKYW